MTITTNLSNEVFFLYKVPTELILKFSDSQGKFILKKELITPSFKNPGNLIRVFNKLFEARLIIKKRKGKKIFMKLSSKGEEVVKHIKKIIEIIGVGKQNE